MKMNLTKTKKENLLFWASMAASIVAGVVSTAFEKAWIIREVEEQINRELEN